MLKIKRLIIDVEPFTEISTIFNHKALHVKVITNQGEFNAHQFFAVNDFGSNFRALMKRATQIIECEIKKGNS